MWLQLRKELVLAQDDGVRKVNLKVKIYEKYSVSAVNLRVTFSEEERRCLLLFIFNFYLRQPR